jgi:hypothetical protein
MGTDMTDVFGIADILVSHALRAHAGSIAIIAYYGSYAQGTASETSDLDLFYIPDPGEARTLCSQFIIDGLPYDFWPVSWRMAEEIANARSSRPWAVSASLIAAAKVLYHRSPADLARFTGLQARIHELTQPESRPFMVERALHAFREVSFHAGQMRLALAREDEAGLYWAGRNLAHAAVNCLALVNQTYFARGWGTNFSQILELPCQPPSFEPLLRAILLPENREGMLAAAEELGRAVRRILAEAQTDVTAPESPQEVFRDFYFFVFEYANKVVSACQRRDVMAATAAACQMQEQICQLMNKVDRGFFGSEFNLLGEYGGGYRKAGFPDLIGPASRGDLAALEEGARQLDAAVRAWLESHAVDLGILSSTEELHRFLNNRDPA